MKINQWTLGLAAAGVVSLASAVQAEEAKNQVLTAVSSTTISGFVSTSARWDLGTPAGVNAYKYAAPAGVSKGDGFNLDVVNLTVSKAAGEGDWAAGYKAELVFGPDAAQINPAGNNIKQAYVSLRAPVGNGLDLKMGVFDSIVGYESTNAGDNPNYTRSWGHTIDPSQHTGLLAGYRFNDTVALTVGAANTTGIGAGGINAKVASAQSQKTYLAGITLTAGDSLGFLKGGTLTAAAVDGRAAGAVAGPDASSIYVGATLPTGIENLTLGAAWDHRNVDKASDTEAMAVYLSYKASDKLKVNVRADYLDNGGALVAPYGLGVEILTSTVTLDYALWENVISRVEWRWDHAMSGRQGAVGGAGVGPFGGGRVNANMVALNVIYKF